MTRFMYRYSVDQVTDMAHRQVPRGAVPIGIVDLQSPLYVFPWSRLYGNLLLFERYYEEACFDNIYDMGW